MNNPSKARDVTGGYNAFAESFPFVNLIMFIFGWFTVPVEILFRRNFGQRWLTVINFYAGLFVLLIFTALQTAGGAIGSLFSSHQQNNTGYPYQQQMEQPSGPFLWERFLDKSMLFILLAYMLVSSYHFFKIWWRNRTNTALHSFDDGTSWFEPVAVYLMRLMNVLAVPVLRFYMFLLPIREQRKRLKVPPLFEDATAFTNTVFEPLMLLILAIIFHGATRWWLIISFPALAIYANWKETAKLNKVLDFRDSVIEAETMQKNRHSQKAANRIIKQAAETIKENPQAASAASYRYPDLMDIIEDMNKDKSHLADE